uniref:ANF_receptor domain-containing protein n=1 Tax=Elaeophora elaphi TaxID=1147741 RepID=A0A0R3RKZ1_9BILA
MRSLRQSYCTQMSFDHREIPVDATEFIDSANEYFPDATLSIGWTKSNLSELTIPQMNIGWHELLHVLALIKDVDQPLVLAIRLSTAACSSKQIEFILGIRPTISALIWSDEMDLINDWYEIINLRSGLYSKRLVFDLHAKHRSIFKVLPYSIVMSESEFNRSHWNLIEFPSVFAQSSGAVVSDEGIAFIGWPTAFLISLMRPLVFPNIQRITAKLIFVKKKQNTNDDWFKHSGFVIYLLEKVLDLQSPEITTGIKVFIGYNGRLSIENRGKRHNYYNMKASGQVRHDQNCYDLELIDRGWQVELLVEGSNCQGRKLTNPTKITLETTLTK